MENWRESCSEKKFVVKFKEEEKFLTLEEFEDRPFFKSYQEKNESEKEEWKMIKETNYFIYLYGKYF